MGEQKHINKVPPTVPGQSHENFVYVFFYESVCPLQGSKSPRSGKEGFGVKKNPFPTTPEKGVPSPKNPHFPCSALYGNGDFLAQSAFFYNGGKWGFFDSETFFSGFWGF